MRWLLLLSQPADGATNMAVDHALMDRARLTGETVLRVYSWDRPVLSLGRNQQAAGCYDDAEIERRSVGVVRRPTGGRALLHHREITYSVTAPASDALPDTYERINKLLLHVLSDLGIDATISAGVKPATPPTDLPCFAEPSAGEIVVDGKKLIGSAQWRENGALLQHGSILVDNDQSLICSLMRKRPPAPAGPATLRELLDNVPSVDDVFEAFSHAVRVTEDNRAQVADNLEAEVDIATHSATYRDPAWTWRR